MAINIFTVGPGADYETLSGWALDRFGASSAGDTERALLIDGAYIVTGNNSLVTLSSSWVADVNIEIFAENSHTGDFNVTNQGAVILLSGALAKGIVSSTTNNVYIKDIVFRTLSNGNFIQGYQESNATINVKKTRIFENLLFSGFGNNSSTNQSAFSFEGVGTNTTGSFDLDFRNCVFWDCPTKSDGGAIYLNSWSSSIGTRGYATVRNSTFHNAGIYLSRFWTGYDMTITGIGNIFYRPDTGASITWRHPTGSYSAVSIDQIGSEGDGAHEIAWNTSVDNYLSATSVAGEPSAGQVGFISTGAGNFRLYSSPNNVAINYVTSTLGYTGDILGSSRSTTYDAGAFEDLNVIIEPSPIDFFVNTYTGSVNKITTRTVGPGGDYTTMSAWQSARTGVAVAGDIEIAELLDQIYTGQWSLGLWNSGVQVVARAQNSHNGSFNYTGQGVKWVNNAANYSINVAASSRPLDVTIEDIHFNNYHQANVLNTEGLSGYYVTINRCLFDILDTGNGNLSYGIRVGTTTGQTGYIDINSSVFIGPYNALSAIPTSDQKLEITSNRSTYYRARMGAFGSTNSVQKFYLSGCLIYSGSNWSIRNSATISTFLTDCIVSDTLGNPFDNVTKVHSVTGAFVSGEPASGQVGFIDPHNENRLLRDFRLYDSANNLAIDYATGNQYTGADVIGNELYGSFYDAGAFEFQPSNIDVEIEPTSLEVTIDFLNVENEITIDKETDTSTISYTQSDAVATSFISGVSRSTYKAGIEHVHINLRPQLPDREDAWQAWGEWHLYRSGAHETGIFNVLDFSWPLLPEHDLYYRYAFSDGTTGNWNHIESQATYDWDFEQYVDSTLGNNANDGLSGEAPVQTIAQAFTNMVPYIASGATIHILLKAGETFAAGTSPVWTGSNQDFRLFFDRYSTGNKPKISCSASSSTALFQIGGRSHVVVKDIDFFATNDQSSGGNHILSWDTNRQTDVSIDCGIYNVTCSGLASFLSSASNMTIDDKVNGAADYFFVYNSTNGTPARAWWQWWGGHNLTKISLVDFTLNYVTGNAVEGCHRVYNWSNLFAHNYRINKQEANPWRIYGGSGEQGFIENMSFSHVTISGSTNVGLLAEVRFQPLGTGTIIRNVRFNGCNFVHDARSDGGLSFATNEDNANWRFTDIDNISVWNSNFAFPRYTPPSWTGTTATNIEFKNNTNLVSSNNAYTNYAIELGDWATRIESGTLHIDSNVFWWLNKNQSRASFMSWSTLTPEAMSGVLGYSDHNVQLYKNTGIAIRWWPDDSNPPPRFDYTYLRSEVCSIFGYDCNSVESSTGYPGDFVNDGSSGVAYFNGRMLVGNGLQTGVGRAVTYSIDADNYLRDPVAPDAGAFEFSSVATPERPLEDLPIDVEVEPTPLEVEIDISNSSSLVNLYPDTIELEVDAPSTRVITILDTYISTYNVGRQHGSFSIRNSIVMDGTMNDRDAQGEWRVEREGTIIYRQNNIIEFQWIGLNGDVVHVRAVDKLGNKGSWESYTYVVTPNTSADLVYYVDTSGNDTTGNGSDGNPWATVTKAVTEAQLALTSGQVAVIFLSDDQTWAHTSTLYSGGDSISRLIRFVRRGNGTNRPILTFSNGINAFTAGKRGTFHIDGIDLEGAHLTDAGAAINMVRSGGVAADQSPWNVMVVDCDITDFGIVAYANNSLGSGPTYLDRDAGCFDFIAFQNCTLLGTRSYHFYGFFSTNDVLFKDVAFGLQGGGFNSGVVRIFALGRLYVDGCTTPSALAGIRTMIDCTDPLGSFRNMTFVNCEHVGIAMGPNPGTTGVHYYDHARFVNCRSISTVHLQVKADDGGNYNGINIGTLDMINCESVDGILITVVSSATQPHVYSKIRIKQCISSDIGASFAYLPARASRLADGCYEFVGNVRISGPGNNLPLFFDCGVDITNAQFATKIGISDYNQTIKTDTDTHNWGYAAGSMTLSNWKTTYSHDLNSIQTNNSTGNVTNAGLTVPADADFRLLSDSGPITNMGYPLPYAVDADGYLRSSVAPDAGPYEYAATGLPDDPFTSVDTEPDSFSYYINTSTGHTTTTTNDIQTVLTSYESSYRVGKHHVFFNLRNSIPKEGPMWKGLGEWYVYSSTDTLIKQVNGVLDFSYIGQDGDKLYARYIDSYGYTGAWETYTFDVLPNSSADLTYYVASHGSDINSGTSDSPFATPQHAITTIRSSLLSGETAVLYVSGNTTYSFSGVGWAGGSTPRLVRMLKWGNGTNPIFHMTNNNPMIVLGNAESVQLEGICLSGNTGISAGNYGIAMSKDNSSTNYPNCSYIMSGSVDRFYIGIGSSDSATNGGRYSGYYDFFGIEDTTFYDNSTYHIYGMRYRRYNHVVNPTFYEPRGTIDVANRLQMWAEHYCEGWKCLYTGVTTTIRLQGGDFTVDNGNEYFGPGSWYSGELVPGVEQNGISLQTDAPASGMAIHKDMRFVNWKIGHGRFELVGYTTGANCNFDRIDVINCSINNTNCIAVVHNTGVPYGYVGELRAINNIGFVTVDTAPRFFTCNAPLAYTQTGTLTFVGNAWSVASGTSGGSKSFYQFANITRDQAADLFVDSENNHIGKFDLSAPFMLRASDGDDLIAAWRTRSTFDQNSTINLSYSDPLGIVSYPTEYGYGANARIASTGSPLYNAGYPLEYALDYDGYLRDPVFPDAGPYEFNATDFPTPPLTGQQIDVAVEPDSSSVNIDTYNNYSSIYVEDSSDEIQVEPVDPDTLIGAQPTSSNINISAYTVSAIDVTSNIYTDPDPVEFLITPYIQSAEGQIDIDIEPAAISEIYYSIVTPTVLANSDTVYANPTGQTVVYDQPSVGTISSIVYLEEDPSVIGYNISAGVEILAGTGVVTYPGYGSLLVTVVTPVVSTTSLPGGNIPGMPVEPNANSKEYYDYEYTPNQNIDSTNLRVDDNFTTQENISNKDIDIVPILEIATNVNNDVTRLNQHLSETFIRNTIQQTTRVENKNKVRVVTANYQKFTSSTNGSASRFQIRRK